MDKNIYASSPRRKSEKYAAKLLGLAAIFGVMAGVYILATATAPVIVSRKTTIAKVTVAKQQDQIIIPGVGIKEGIYAGGLEALEKGVWHRFPDRGQPGRGNFIMAAHRFVMGRWPGETLRKSPFYHLDKVKVGDSLYIDWHGRRYAYKVTKVFQVKPSAVEIEAPTTEPKLTLYTCTLTGSADGRLVVQAELH